MPQRFQLQRRVEFRDSDMAGIVHFSNFFVYMEQTEHAFLRSVGLGVVTEINGMKISWPRVNANCNYRQAIYFEDLIDIELFVKRIGNSSVTYGCDFFREGQPVADGLITAVCCEYQPGQRPQPQAIPAEFIQALSPYLA